MTVRSWARGGRRVAAAGVPASDIPLSLWPGAISLSLSLSRLYFSHSLRLGPTGKSALHHAAELNRLPMLRGLCAKLVPLEVATAKGETPLHLAVQQVPIVTDR